MNYKKNTMTVNGMVDSNQLGVCLPHEHLFIDIRFISSESKSSKEIVNINNLHELSIDYTSIADNLFLDSYETALHEVNQFKKFGGKTIVDSSSIGAGRQPELLKKISCETDINIVMGTGFYIMPSLPKSILEENESNLIKTLIKECRDGFSDTGIRPGIIGEVGVNPSIEAWDRKSLKVASAVQKETGLPISVHIQAVPVVSNFTQPNGLEVIKLLEEFGADLEKTVICHTDAKIDLDYITSLLKTGVYAELDHFGKDFYFPESNFLMSRDMDRVLAISKLVEQGYGRRLLISTDICLKNDLTTYGGHGYAHILRKIFPMMKNNGLDDTAIHQITNNNVHEWLSIDSRYL